MKFTILKKPIFWIAVLCVFAIFGYAVFGYPKNKDSSSKEKDRSAVEDTGDQNSPHKDKPEIVIPNSYDLKVPFFSQAPFGVWDELHDNACEEASIILTHFYKTNQSLSKERMDSEIKTMVSWQIKNFGGHFDLNSDQTAELAKKFYGYKNIEVKYDFSWDDLKKEIVSGNPVIVPTAGRYLSNPYFRSPGPVYHMLVIRGYTPTEIISDDVGTRRGDGYRYSYAILDKAIHEWTGNPATILQGRKAMIVLK